MRVTLVYFILLLSLNEFPSSKQSKNPPCYQQYSPGFTAITNFDYCHENKLNSDLDVVIFVVSAIEHFHRRKLIRRTWGSYYKTRVLFCVGKTQNHVLVRHLQVEQYLHEDLIQGKFYDSYSNLTLKTLSILEYSFQHCNNTKFILKCDDDMFLNTPTLKQFISQNNINIANTIVGELREKSRTFRDQNSKYYLSTDEYEGNILPPHLAGAAYLIPRGIIENLYFKALTGPCLKLEDVYITGIVPPLLGIKIMDSEHFRPYRKSKHLLELDSFINLHVENSRTLKNLFIYYQKKRNFKNLNNRG